MKFTKKEFIRRLHLITSATSVTGKTYRAVRVEGRYVTFIRRGKFSPEEIHMDELYDLYVHEDARNTTIAKRYISGRAQSPAVAILDMLDQQIARERGQGSAVEAAADEDAAADGKDVAKPDAIAGTRKKKIKDEDKFFLAFSALAGKECIVSKSIGKPISKSDVFLSDNYLNYSFEHHVIDCYKDLLDVLDSDGSFSSASLSHVIDGLVIGHPVLGTRIVEFDEEQHFTPARKDTLMHLKTIIPDLYVSEYLDICYDLDYLNDAVLKKNRIKNRLSILPESHKEFIQWLQESDEKTSGYIEPKRGFDYPGGRIAQRAYYDSLRDTAHLSPKNKSFQPPLRFAKKQFEDAYQQDFIDLSVDQLRYVIMNQLNKRYDLKLF
jgi:hypothetical protein